MKRIIATGAVAALATLGFAGTASANMGNGIGSQPADGGIYCQQQGIGTLQSLGLLSAVAKGGPNGGIEVVDVGTVPFKNVLALHRSNPELFQTGGVSVVVPGVGAVPATWCDPMS
jgi:hypothetical protein